MHLEEGTCPSERKVQGNATNLNIQVTLSFIPQNLHNGWRYQKQCPELPCGIIAVH